MRLKPIKVNRLIRIIEQLGFKRVRQKGSHISFYHEDGRVLTIPYHSNREIDKGLLLKIIKNDLKLTRNDFLKLL